MTTAQEALAGLREERARMKAQRKLRSCLTHGGEFMSEGPHNRICERCKQQLIFEMGSYVENHGTGHKVKTVSRGV